MVPTYSGYSVYAELKVGSNGTDEGVAETAAGTSAGTSGYGHTTWDEVVSDGVDSDWVRVTLVAGPSGVTWTVGDQAPVHVADSVVGDILSLKVRAAVMGGDRQTSWRDLVASFYDTENSETPAESVIPSRAGNPVASTIGAAPDAEADRTVDLWPEGTGYRMVTLTASVRMQSLLPGIPGNPESVFGQIYLYASAPAVQTIPPEQQTLVVVPETIATVTEPSVVTITNTQFLMEEAPVSVLG